MLSSRACSRPCATERPGHSRPPCFLLSKADGWGPGPGPRPAPLPADASHRLPHLHLGVWPVFATENTKLNSRFSLTPLKGRLLPTEAQQDVTHASVQRKASIPWTPESGAGVLRGSGSPATETGWPCLTRIPWTQVAQNSRPLLCRTSVPLGPIPEVGPGQPS